MAVLLHEREKGRQRNLTLIPTLFPANQQNSNHAHSTDAQKGDPQCHVGMISGSRRIHAVGRGISSSCASGLDGKGIRSIGGAVRVNYLNGVLAGFQGLQIACFQGDDGTAFLAGLQYSHCQKG